MKNIDIYVLGAGFAGITSVRKLAQTFRRHEHIRIKLISKDSYFTFKTRLHEVIGGRILPEEARHDLNELFSSFDNVEIITDHVKKIDKNSKRILTDKAEYVFDHAIVAMGGESNDFDLNGIKEYGFTMWSWQEAVTIRNHIINCVEQAATERNPEKRQALLHVAVCGGGLTGVEIMGELIEWKSVLEDAFNLEKDEIKLTLIQASPEILPVLSPKDRKRVTAYLKKMKVNLLTGASLTSITSNEVMIKDHPVMYSNTLIWTAGIKATRDVSDFPIEFKQAGRIGVKSTTEVLELDDVYAVGDVAYLEDEKGMAIPQNVQTAEQMAKTAVRNIALKINKKDRVKHHKNNQLGTIVSVGATYGVGKLLGKAHIKGLPAVCMKHFVTVQLWIKQFNLNLFNAYFKQIRHLSKQGRYTK